MPEARDWPKKAELIFTRNVAKYRRQKHSGVYQCFIHHKRTGEIFVRVLKLEVSCRPCHMSVRREHGEQVFAVEPESPLSNAMGHEGSP